MNIEAALDKLPDLITILTAVLATMGVAAAYARSRIMKESRRIVGQAFRETVEGLSSDKDEVKTASAIILRRFLDPKSEFGIGRAPFQPEAINVAAALLKDMPTGKVQKILAETFAHAEPSCLDKLDLQGANLSGAYLAGIKLTHGDFFRARIFSASFRNATLESAQFREAILKNVNFRGAVLKGADFAEAYLENVDFSGADLEGVSGLDEAILKRITGLPAHLNVQPTDASNHPKLVGEVKRLSKKKIFLSRPSSLNDQQARIFRFVLDILTARGIDAVQLPPSDYCQVGSLAALMKTMKDCEALVVFGFRSFTIESGGFREFCEDGCSLENTYLSSPWCQLETGIFLQKEAPILAISENGVAEGIFDPSIRDKSVDLLSLGEGYGDISKQVQTWIDKAIAN